MNKKVLLLLSIIACVTLLTVVAGMFKPSINKTVILQIQKSVQK